MSLNDILEEVKNAYDIVEVVSNYVKLKKVGKNFVGFCPFHSEKVPSFVVSPEKQIFKCFGCGVAGDVVTFYAKIKGISFKESLLELAEKIGISVNKKYFIEKRQEKSLIELNYKIAKFYHHLLYHHESCKLAQEYLKDREISEETIKTFLIGFAPSEGRVLVSYFRSLAENFENIKQLGLIKETSDGSYLDLFRGRIIFPIFNIKGECVGFGGRALDKDTEPKYLNTPETKIYKKSEVLYGIYQAKEFIKHQNVGILVEGYFDFLTLWENGIRNVVATCGTALTEKHTQILKTLAENWIIFFDGDSAGKKATLRAISLFLKVGILPKCISLCEDDPDSWVKKNKLKDEILKTKLDELSIDGIKFVLEFYKNDWHLNPSKTFKEIIEVFKPVNDPILRNKIAKELSLNLEVSETEILKYLAKGISDFEEIREKGQIEKKEELSLKIIAQFLINYPEYFSELESVGLSTLIESYDLSSPYEKFLKYVITELKKGNKEFQYIPDLEFQEILSDLLLSPPFENKEEVLIQIKEYIKKENIKKEIKKFTENLKIFQTQGLKDEVEKYLLMLKKFIKDKGGFYEISEK